MNRIALLVLAALAIAVPAATAAPAQKQASPTIATLAAETPQLSTLLSLVKKAGLADELSAPGALTVFAPTNAAFRQVPKATLNSLAKNPAALKRVLLYHVVAGDVPVVMWPSTNGPTAAVALDALEAELRDLLRTMGVFLEEQR